MTFHGAIQPITNEDNGTELPVFRLYDLQIENQPSILCFSDALLDSYKRYILSYLQRVEAMT